jgi:hypothetical protein
MHIDGGGHDSSAPDGGADAAGQARNWPVIEATAAAGAPPAWALMQRRLFDLLDYGWRRFAGKYCRPDGSLRFRREFGGRDGADDFYETFFNWPVLYELGGADDLLAAAKHHWEGVTGQLAEWGFLIDEYERGYDWFHQGEAQLFFYSLCAADPGDALYRARARRFAGLFLPGSPAGNYDPDANVLLAAFTGSGGPYGRLDDWVSPYGAEHENMRTYGLPLDDLDGIDKWDDLADAVNAKRMGESMHERLGPGDTAVNLAATSLAANAWLYDHRIDYRAWLVRYVDGWRERAEANDGILPDNVGPSGRVGELHGGRWHGGYYGWTWPHGLHSVGAAAVVGALNGALVSGRTDYLTLARGPLDLVLAHGRQATPRDEPMSLHTEMVAKMGSAADRPALLVPYRYGRNGWFDYQPFPTRFALWLWWFAMESADHDRLVELRQRSGYDWRTVNSFREKEEAGHEEPWFAFLSGDNPGYPEAILAEAHAQAVRRLDLIDADDGDPVEFSIHHWQWLNPVLTEALLQLTTGSPQMLYNGGLPMLRLKYFDVAKGRPGLPADVAALVTGISATHTDVELVNLAAGQARRVLVQAGGFAEHSFTHVEYAMAGDGYPGDPIAYLIPDAGRRLVRRQVSSGALEVRLPPRTRISLRLGMAVRSRPPRHADPFTDRHLRLTPAEGWVE